MVSGVWCLTTWLELCESNHPCNSQAGSGDIKSAFAKLFLDSGLDIGRHQAAQHLIVCPTGPGGGMGTITGNMGHTWGTTVNVKDARMLIMVLHRTRDRTKDTRQRMNNVQA